jgi:hypothetical protein
MYNRFSFQNKVDMYIEKISLFEESERSKRESSKASRESLNLDVKKEDSD